MALSPGKRLGPYEVTALIGVGGMGEVYRATDTNLKRVVALKVLPAAVAGDAERLARFQRKAEVLASLNHPNIAAIYGLEQSPAEAGHYAGADAGRAVRGEGPPDVMAGFSAGPCTHRKAPRRTSPRSTDANSIGGGRLRIL